MAKWGAKLRRAGRAPRGALQGGQPCRHLDFGPVQPIRDIWVWGNLLQQQQHTYDGGHSA